MGSESTDAGFTVWGADQTPYGPVELPTLVSWVKDERVTADTWLFIPRSNVWQKAADVTELQMFFRPKGTGGPKKPIMLTPGEPPDARSLRRIKILAGLTDAQLDQFVKFTEVEIVPQDRTVVKQGDNGDAMYLIVFGELRVRIDAGGKETILATMGIGDFFGDMSLFDQGPRSADVVANTDSMVLRLTYKSMQELSREAPELATPFLMAVGKTLTNRIRADNKKISDAIKFARATQ